MSVAEKGLQVLNTTNQVSRSLSDFSREEIDTIKRTVAKGVTDAELSMFLTICGRYGLDPFLKEIWCYKRQKKDNNGRYVDDPNAPAIITTSRDGYLKVAQRDDQFDGIKSFVVREGDTFEIDADNDKVVHKFGAKRGRILGAWASVYHKNRRPVIVYAEFDEYNANANVWKSYPSAMIQKVAEALALKRQFGISGLVTQEEMGFQEATVDSQTIDASYKVGGIVNESKPDPREQWLEAASNLKKAAVDHNITDGELRDMGQRETGNPDPRTWSLEQMAHLETYIMSFDQKGEVIDVQPGATRTDGLPNDDELPF